MSAPNESTGFSRRFFSTAIASGVAVPALMAQQNPPAPAAAPNPNTNQQRRGTAPEVAPFDGQIEFSRKDIALKATPFPMTQVRLLPSVYLDAQDWNRGYMGRLNADRLLYNFRANAGLPLGNVEALGGWEQRDNGQRGSELRGHFTGHFLSASALLYASTGDKEVKAKGDYMVDRKSVV